jgi:hypothetical protein
VRFAERFCHCNSAVKEESMNGIIQQFDALQRMMLVPSSAALTDNVLRFWDAQDKLLGNMEKFANGWFERRHIGSHAAREAAQRMCTAQTPEDLGREYQEWVTGAFQRVTDDGFACQQLVGAFAALLMDAAQQQQPEKRTPRQPEKRTPSRFEAA